MPSNVEIKARVRDLGRLRARAARLSDTQVMTFTQLDTFFTVGKGRLKLREQASKPAQLIYYERPDQQGPKRSDYSVFETDNPAALKALLTQALGIRGVVEKVRQLYLVGQTRIHLDQVKNLGDFMELEVMLEPGQSTEEGQALADELLDRLTIAREDLLEVAYVDLLEQTPPVAHRSSGG